MVVEIGRGDKEGRWVKSNGREVAKLGGCAAGG